MDTLKEVLEELELECLLEGEFIDEIKLVKLEKNYVEEVYGGSIGTTWYIVKGWVKGNTYFGRNSEMKWDLRGGNWFGFEEAILGHDLAYDIEAMNESIVLEIPMRKLYNSPNTTPEVLKALMWHMAMAKKFLEDTVLDRLGLSDEGFFLKYLENNGFSISYRNQQDISDVLAINTRTFQRILKALEEEGVISIIRGRVEVTTKEIFYKYIEDKKLWE